MKKFIPGTLLVAGLLTAGGFVACHSFSTVQGPIEDNRVKGLIYYLPKGQIHITGDFKPSGGGAAAATAKSPGVAAASFTTAAPTGPDSAEQKNFVITIAADVEADPSARYYLKPVRNYFYDDDIKLSVNAKHLLSTGNATAQDQTAQIISTAASVAAQAFGVPVPGPAPGGRFYRRGEKPPPLEEPTTVNGLLLLIQDAIIKNNATLDTTLPSAALFELPKALPAQSEGEAFLKVLLRENFVSLGMIMKLLKSYAPEEKIKLSNAREFWQKLKDALSGEVPRQKYVQPRPFSIVFDPATHSTPIGTPRNVPVCDPNDCGLTVTITEETQQPEMASKLKTIWEGNRTLLTELRSVRSNHTGLL